MGVRTERQKPAAMGRSGSPGCLQRAGPATSVVSLVSALVIVIDIEAGELGKGPVQHAAGFVLVIQRQLGVLRALKSARYCSVWNWLLFVSVIILRMVPKFEEIWYSTRRGTA